MNLIHLKACNGKSFNISLDSQAQQQIEHLREFYRQKFQVQCSRATIIRRGLDMLANKAMLENPQVERQAIEKASTGTWIPKLPEVHRTDKYPTWSQRLKTSP